MNFSPAGNHKRNKLGINGNNGLAGIRCGLTGQKVSGILDKFPGLVSIYRGRQCPAPYFGAHRHKCLSQRHFWPFQRLFSTALNGIRLSLGRESSHTYSP